MVDNSSLGSSTRQGESKTNHPSRSRLHGARRVLTDVQPEEETVLQKTPSLAVPRGVPRDTSFGFGHLIWLLAAANHGVFLHNSKPHLQSDKFPAELGAHFLYCDEETVSSLREVAAFHLHELDVIPKFMLGKMLISAKRFLNKSSFINGI